MSVPVRPSGPVFVYRAEVRRVVDGDTVVLRVDLGFDAKLDVRARIAGINAPELHGASMLAGQAARAQLEDLLRLAEADGPILIASHKGDRSFERWVCDMWLSDGTSVGDVMVSGGHATYVQRP